VSSLAIPGGGTDAGSSGSPSTGQEGPEIIDDFGRPVWFLPITNGQSAAD
jgi:hypothetical protein